MTTSISRGREKHISPLKLMDRQTDIRTDIRTDISIYRVASLLLKKFVPRSVFMLYVLVGLPVKICKGKEKIMRWDIFFYLTYQFQSVFL